MQAFQDPQQLAALFLLLALGALPLRAPLGKRREPGRRLFGRAAAGKFCQQLTIKRLRLFGLARLFHRYSGGEASLRLLL